MKESEKIKRDRKYVCMRVCVREKLRKRDKELPCLQCKAAKLPITYKYTWYTPLGLCSLNYY